MRRLMLLVVLCAGSLAGCGTTPRAPEPVILTVEIRVPVPVPCISEMPTRPKIYSQAEILVLPNAEAAERLLAQDNVLKSYVGEIEAVAGPCVTL